jgi:hypothetical protein
MTRQNRVDSTPLASRAFPIPLAKDRFIFLVNNASLGAGIIHRALLFEFTQTGPNRPGA